MPSLRAVTEASSVDQLWFTRCPVPTGSGLAHQLGWLSRAMGAHEVSIGVLQDAPLEIARHHYDHRLVGLIREGGNVPALAARADGAPTKLVGLTWIDEGQAVVVREDSQIHEAGDLGGARIAVPAWASTRDKSMARAMAVAGFRGALRSAGLTVDDVRWHEIFLDDVIPPGRLREERNAPRFRPLDAVAAGEADAAYVKGAADREAAEQRGLRVVVDLDAMSDRRFRVNNGTPRPITVHEELLQQRPELIVEFLAETLAAADWAADNVDSLREILAAETGAGCAGVELAYTGDFHRSLHPTLDPTRLDLLAAQKDFLLHYGFLSADFDFDSWIEPELLVRARARLRERTA